MGLKVVEKVSLILGLIALFLDVGVILFVYGYIAGMASAGNQFIVTYEGLRVLIIAMFGILALGFFSGYEVGKYIEKQRKTKT